MSPRATTSCSLCTQRSEGLMLRSCVFHLLITKDGRQQQHRAASEQACREPSQQSARPSRPPRASHLCSFPVCGSLVPQSADAAACTHALRADLIWLIKSLWAPICALNKGRRRCCCCCTVPRPSLLSSAWMML